MLWSDGPVSYLGLCVAAFPYLFMLSGAGSPAALSNAVATIEHHAEFVARCLLDLRSMGMSPIEATEGAQHRWSYEVRALLQPRSPARSTTR
ncbi:Phenylacetone monooxygenase [compost metagenome]